MAMAPVPRTKTTPGSLEKSILETTGVLRLVENILERLSSADKSQEK